MKTEPVKYKTLTTQLSNAMPTKADRDSKRASLKRFELAALSIGLIAMLRDHHFPITNC